jgi:hypothetical protein
MTELKTKKNDANVLKFLDSVDNQQRREDSLVILEMMERVTGEKAKMWGESIVGFGSYHYVYASGREGDWMCTGFSPRKAAMTIYVMPGFEKKPALMKKLGKFKTAKSCLYIKKLEDVDIKVLEKLVFWGYDWMVKKQSMC